MADSGEWITVNGRHILIGDGESREDAINRAIAKKNEDIKEKQINQNKAQADKLNGKSNPSLDKVGNKGYHIKDKDGRGRTIYVSGIKNGKYTWVTDYTYAKLYNKGTAEKHIKAIKGN